MMICMVFFLKRIDLFEYDEWLRLSTLSIDGAFRRIQTDQLSTLLSKRADGNIYVCKILKYFSSKQYPN